MLNATATGLNITTETFLVNPGWLLNAIFWLPSVVFGLPCNLFVMLLSNKTKELGNFCFAINILSLVNIMHCCSRGVVVIYYFIHQLLFLETSLISCTFVSIFLSKCFGFYIVFCIPILSGYRVVLLCTKHGEYYLTKRNLCIAVSVIFLFPTASIIGLVIKIITDTGLDFDSMCSFRYSDRGCLWCSNITTYGAYVSYALSFIFAILLFVHLFRSFRKIDPHINKQSIKRHRDELGILLCIAVHTVIPVLLTIPSKSIRLFQSLGFNQMSYTFATALYNYNPLFDAILIIICVKPYRRAVLRLVRMGNSNLTVNSKTIRTTTKPSLRMKRI
jgi:hypothetical protein